ncbi:MAG: repair protein RadA, partial [Desulfacinum sp.]|nr:repair protein RadA [Desulfacinum sp.]
MAREKALYRCQECGYESPKWLGRCPGCQAWNSFVEEAPAASGPGRRAAKGQAAQALPLGAVPTSADRRLQSGLQEWDRVLGGGLVPGSVVLLAGDPGIGKSTLLLQALARLARSGPVLYVSGEESLSQIRLRAERLGLGLSDHVLVCAETSVDAVVPLLESTKFLAVAVDSIQTMRLDLLESAPGSVSQVRESAAWLQR